MTLTLVFALSLAIGQARALPSAEVPGAPADGRWSWWLGCWQVYDAEGEPRAARSCVVPGEGPGVRLLTLEGDVVAADESLVADGASRPVRDQECSGTETAEWSLAKARPFRRAELTCNGARRSLASLWFPTRGDSWVEVLAVKGAGERSVRVRYYERASDQRLPGGATLAPRSGMAAEAARAIDPTWTVADVIEASAQLPVEVVQAALVQLDGPIPLNARALVAMADGGVAEDVIDLLVALSNPGRFQVHRTGASIGFSEWSASDSSIFWPVGPYAGLFGFGYWETCSAFYGCGGYYPYYPGDGWVVIPPPGGGGGPGPARTEARVVNGFGYTQVSVRTPGSPGLPGSGGAGAGGSSSGDSGSQASPAGYSGGSGSAGGSDRTAQPRTPGGG